MANLSGTWKLEKNENFDAYLSALGMGMVKRKVASATTPTMEIKQDGTHFYIKTSTMVSTQVMDFNAGDTFPTDIPGITTGKWQCVSSWDGSVLKTVASPGPEDKDLQPTTILRELSGEQMIQTFVVGDITAKRFYKRTS